MLKFHFFLVLKDNYCNWREAPITLSVTVYSPEVQLRDQLAFQFFMIDIETN